MMKAGVPEGLSDPTALVAPVILQGHEHYLMWK
jgi:hypothetical protein